MEELLRFDYLLGECKGDACTALERFGDSSDENVATALHEMKRLMVVLGLSVNTSTSTSIRVKLFCNWTDPQSLAALWNSIEIVSENPDYFVVVNSTRSCDVDAPRSEEELRRTVLFRMEPHMHRRPDLWGEYTDPDPKRDQFLFAGYHEEHFNNNEWHLSKTYSELMNMSIEKTIDGVSAILSNKYVDPGHVLRVDFVKQLEEAGLNVAVFGGNKFEWRDYRGSLPSHAKEGGLFPYKYTFNVENFCIENYYTEKLIDGILSECLTFYYGCPNIRELIDERAYVWLDLNNFGASVEKVKEAIETDLWSKRLVYIRAAKQKILNETQFFPRLEQILLKAKKTV
jgi:hypothetical protein